MIPSSIVGAIEQGAAYLKQIAKDIAYIREQLEKAVEKEEEGE